MSNSSIQRRRLHRLETQRLAVIAANDASGAREELMARIARIRKAQQANPIPGSQPKATVAEVRQRILEALSVRN